MVLSNFLVLKATCLNSSLSVKMPVREEKEIIHLNI